MESSSETRKNLSLEDIGSESARLYQEVLKTSALEIWPNYFLRLNKAKKELGTQKKFADAVRETTELSYKYPRKPRDFVNQEKLVKRTEKLQARIDTIQGQIDHQGAVHQQMQEATQQAALDHYLAHKSELYELAVLKAYIAGVALDIETPIVIGSEQTN